LRISLAGGGTDLPAYYRQYGGAVINTSINRYFYVFLRTMTYNGLEISSADYRTFFHQDGDHPLGWQGDLELPRAVFDHFGITRGVSLFIASEIPPGTGLGSSSSVSVGLLKALSAACGLHLSRSQIAEIASFIEIKKMGAPIGKQDQYAAAFGGLNLIEFKTHETHVTPLDLSLENRQILEKSLMLFYTKQSRSASEILSQQRDESKKKEGPTLEALHKVKGMVPKVKECLESGDMETFGRLLHENWKEKKRFAKGITSSFIDKCYDAAVHAGAWGGKIAGAGGGGFLLVCCDESRKQGITEQMEKMGLIRVGFQFEDTGARVITNSGLRLTSRTVWNGSDHLIAKI